MPDAPSPAPGLGLTAAEVAERVARGQVNRSDDRTSRTVGEIIKANVVTRFNAMLAVLFAAVLATGRLGDGLFGFVVVLNSAIGVVQEVRAKRTLDRLALLNAPTARVVRDGRAGDIASSEVVLDDLVELRAGDQVCADGVVAQADGLEIDESLLTGESDPVAKSPGDDVLSGSFVVAGSGRFATTAVGEDAYARRLATEARRFTLVSSELRDGIDRLLRYLTWVIVAITPVLLWSQFRQDNPGGWREAVTASVAALVGMIPEGLVLLTSIAFLLAALTLARRQVLVQELPAVEGLARVDVVCLDKTGTLTDGTIELDDVHLLVEGPGQGDRVRAALGALAADEAANATLRALSAALGAPGGWERTASVPFSSARKWSAATFEGQGTWVLGAPELLLADDSEHRPVADELAASGRRVLLVATAPRPRQVGDGSDGLTPVALCSFTERVRPDAADTLAYFAAQGVTLKVLSGDNPRTVGAIAGRLGLDPASVDARQLPSDPEDLADAVEGHGVFGRVTPEQKRAMVRALQSRGHVVAMTGDGVNDALALKDADIGVAMGSGAAATRAVAQLVLLDGRFDRLPAVLEEGRRVTRNVERVANLFVTKNVYSIVLALAVAVAGLPYPFLPRHLTLISSLTIGIPAFWLAFGRDAERYRPGFLHRVLRFAAPSGLVVAIAAFAAYSLARAEDVAPDEARTSATVALVVVALWVLVVLARPLRAWKVALITGMAAAFGVALAVPWIRHFFVLEIPVEVLPQALAIGAAGAFVVELVGRRALDSAPAGGGSRPRPPAPKGAGDLPYADRS